jgi:predicted MPP superfamily phosphohydrolase
MEVVSLVLLLGACLGHIAILVFSINWWYAWPLPRRLLTALRLLHGWLILVGCTGFAWVYFSSSSSLLGEQFSGEVWRVIAGSYTLTCVLVGLAVFPWISLHRLFRRRPAVLLSNHTKTIDVAEQLGYKPIGRGKYRHLARLPRNEVFQVDFAERTLRLPDLPAAWEGLTILHLSDLHFIGSPDRPFFQYVMDRCREWEPDLVALTGDVVDTVRHHRWIIPVLGRLRWRVAAFGILGNHDWWRDPPVIRRRLRRIGFHVLGNSWEQMAVRGLPLVVIGHEGPWFRPAPDLKACPTDVFRLCLSHTPDNIRWAKQQRINLMLAGHNHGGQIRFPMIGSVLVPSTYSRRYDCGLFHEPPTVLHVSRGLSGKHPLRYNCRPEVTKIVLTS